MLHSEVLQESQQQNNKRRNGEKPILVFEFQLLIQESQPRIYVSHYKN